MTEDITDTDRLPRKRTILITLLAIMLMLSGAASGILSVNNLFDGVSTNNFEGLIIILSVLIFVTGYGLWKLKTWARRAALLLSYIWLLGAFLGALIEIIIPLVFTSKTAAVGDAGLQTDNIYVFILEILFTVLIIVYLSQKRIRERFS